MWWWTLAAWGAPCATPVPAADLQATVDAAREAAMAGRTDDLDALVPDLRQGVECAAEVVTPSLAAQLHFTEAFLAFRHRLTHADDAERMGDHLCAVAALRAEFDAWPLPESHALMRGLAEADCSLATVESPATSLWVDGRPTTRLPSHRPFLLQQTDGGQVNRSQWVDREAIPVDLLPTPEAAAPPAPTPAPPPPTPTSRRSRRAAGAATALAGVGLAALGTYWVTGARAGYRETGSATYKTYYYGGWGASGAGAVGVAVGTALWLRK